MMIAASKAVREAFEDAYRLVVATYQLASAKLRAGDRLVSFPDGTFPPALAFEEPRVRIRAS